MINGPFLRSTKGRFGYSPALCYFLTVQVNSIASTNLRFNILARIIQSCIIRAKFASLGRTKRRFSMSRILNLLSEFGRKLDFGHRGLGKEFGKVASFFFRLILVILLFWYLIESVSTLWPHHEVMASTLALGSFAVLSIFLILLVKKFSQFDQAADADKNLNGSVIPFLLLNLPFVAAVEFATRWCGHVFPGGLLRFTQSVLQWIGRYLS